MGHDAVDRADGLTDGTGEGRLLILLIRTSSTACRQSAILSAVSKATLYLDDDLHRALRLKAAETRESMSGLVNEALRVLLAEDLEDISDWQQRRAERAVTYEEFLKQLAADGTI